MDLSYRNLNIFHNIFLEPTVYFKRKLPDTTMITETTTEVEFTVEVSEESASVTWLWYRLHLITLIYKL
jgi:hypothetical protein